jgi:hypothetical protein
MSACFSSLRSAKYSTVELLDYLAAVRENHTLRGDVGDICRELDVWQPFFPHLRK